MENKQTAVEWLIEQINSEEYQKAFGQTYVSIELVEQAKEMEKWQMLECWEEGQLDRKIELMPHGGSALILPSDPEEGFDLYYNQTYGNV